MSTVVARRVASTPVRTASATWAKISELLAPDPKSPARAELDKVKGVAASSIAAEAPTDSAIITHGGGLHVRTYCVFDDDAISGDGVEEGALPRSATEGDWKVSIPFREEDLAWAKRELKRLSTRVTAREVGTEIEQSKSSRTAESAATNGKVDLAEFFKP